MRYSIFITATLSAVATVAALIAGLNAHSQTSAPPAVKSDPGSGLGKQLANIGAPTSGVAACATCHGAQGEGNAAANFPRIAGQPHLYLARQLSAYANGSRTNPVMTPIAKALSRDQIDAVSAYYAALAAPSPKPASTAAPAVLKRGELLANVGDERIAVQSCANCHGPGGIGEPPSYPYLAGQHGGYLAAAMAEWKSGTRKTDPSQQMNLIAKRLSDQEVAAVIAYYAAQPAPPPAAQRVMVPAGSVARPAAPSTPQPIQAPSSGQTSVPTQGIGVEQGSPTTGGGQGPGGGGGASGTGPSGSPKQNAQ